jgi:hypothetical protein
MPITLLPSFWPERRFFSSQLNIVAPLSSASFKNALVTGPWSAPIFPFESGALIFRICTRSILSSRAALSISGSIAGTSWFSPGPRCGPRRGVLVSTGIARKRIAVGW